MEKKVLSENEQLINSDVLRYKKNKLPATLALIGLVFNCLFFTLMYSLNTDFFYKLDIGLSVIITLLMLLMIFLSSEGIKNYNKSYAILLLVLAAVQIIRIFFLPLQGLQNGQLTNSAYPVRYFGVDLAQGVVFTFMVIYLVGSAACLVASAVLGYINTMRMQSIAKKVESGEVDMLAVIKEVEAEEEAKAQEAGDSSEEAAEDVAADTAAGVEKAAPAPAPAEKAETPSDASANNADEEVQ